jgi:hypothetical protein
VSSLPTTEFVTIRLFCGALCSGGLLLNRIVVKAAVVSRGFGCTSARYDIRLHTTGGTVAAATPQRVAKSVTALPPDIFAPTDSFAIVFRHLRVKLRPAKGKADPPKVERVVLNALLPLPQGITHHLRPQRRRRTTPGRWARSRCHPGSSTRRRASCGRWCN